ncbi:MAG: hydrogenase/urease maturation nickel metallochaperone HypA [Pyrobaculum sp.]
MHEVAIVEAIVSTVERYVRERNVYKLRRVTIRVGELQRLDLDVVRDSAAMSLASSGIHVGEVVVEEEKAALSCRKCGFTWGLLDMSDDVREMIHFLPEAVFTYFTCPNCGSRDYDVKSGRALKVAIEEYGP